MFEGFIWAGRKTRGLAAPLLLGLSLIGCGGLAVDGPRRLLEEEGDVRLEALPQRLTNCDALSDYARAQAENLLGSAPTGSPFQPLFPPADDSGFRAPSYAEWPRAKQQNGAGRMAHSRVQASDAFYVAVDDGLAALTLDSSVSGTYLAMPASLALGRSAGGPAWVFSSGARVLVVGALDLSAIPNLPWPAGALPSLQGASAAAARGTFFWELEIGGNGVLEQQVRYVDAELLGARSTEGSVQAVLRVERPSLLPFWNLAAAERDQPTALERARSHNRDVLAGASGSDWLPTFFEPDVSNAAADLPSERQSERVARVAAMDGNSGKLLACNEIYAPATDSGLNLLTWVDIGWEQGLAGWHSVGLYTGDVQVLDTEQRWTFVTEPWWSASESAARELGHFSPETIVHSFEERAGSLTPSGSIAVRGSPLHDEAVVDTGKNWFLATHAAYGPVLGEQDEARIWSFRAGQAALTHLGTSPGAALAADQRSDFAGDVAYLHAANEQAASTGNVRFDLSDAEAPRLLDAPDGFFHVLPWGAGQHLLVDAAQIRVQSGVRDVEAFTRKEGASSPVYADPNGGWLVDIDGTNPRRNMMRFYHLSAGSPLQPAGSVVFRNRGALFPPLIESNQILNAYFTPRGARSSSSYQLEVRDANTFQIMGGVGGG